MPLWPTGGRGWQEVPVAPSGDTIASRPFLHSEATPVPKCAQRGSIRLRNRRGPTKHPIPGTGLRRLGLIQLSPARPRQSSRAVLASVTTSVTKRPAFPVVAGPTVRPKCLKFSGFDGCLDSVRRFAPDFGSLVPGSSPGRVTSSRKSHPRRSLRNPKRKRRNTLRRFHSLTLQVAELASKWRCPMADEE